MKNKLRELQPFRSIDSPETGLLSLASAIALVTVISFFTEDETNFLWKNGADDILLELESLAHDDTLELPLRIVPHGLKPFLEGNWQCLSVAI